MSGTELVDIGCVTLFLTWWDLRITGFWSSRDGSHGCLGALRARGAVNTEPGPLSEQQPQNVVGHLAQTDYPHRVSRVIFINGDDMSKIRW